MANRRWSTRSRTSRLGCRRRLSRTTPRRCCGCCRAWMRRTPLKRSSWPPAWTATRSLQRCWNHRSRRAPQHAICSGAAGGSVSRATRRFTRRPSTSPSLRRRFCWNTAQMQTHRRKAGGRRFTWRCSWERPGPIWRLPICCLPKAPTLPRRRIWSVGRRCTWLRCKRPASPTPCLPATRLAAAARARQRLRWSRRCWPRARMRRRARAWEAGRRGGWRRIGCGSKPRADGNAWRSAIRCWAHCAPLAGRTTATMLRR